MDVTELPMRNEDKPEQPEKALLPNDITELGIEADVKLEQP